jgi:RND family efflux transporter MFP subunit
MSPERSVLDELRIHRPGGAAGARGGSWIGIAGTILCVICVLALLGWWVARPRGAAVRTVAAREVSATRAGGAGGDRTLLNASGYVTARREATVSSKVTGKVLEVLVEEGTKVSDGQVLARLDASNIEKSLRLAEAQLESARKALGEIEANLKQAENELHRRQGAGSAVSQSDLDRADADAKAFRARLDRQNADISVAQREVDTWKQQLDDMVIAAPFAGVVTAKNAQPGEMISPMSVGGFTRTGICTIVDMSSLEIEVDVGESYINRVSPGQPVEATLDSYPSWKIPAKVIAIIPTADRQKATVKVRIGFVKLDPRILPDMSVKVAFQSAAEAPATSQGAVATPPLILLPKAALRQWNGKDVVWLVHDGVAERRAVKVGDDSVSGDEVTIAAGVRAGEQVVVEGQDHLVDGAKVSGE